MRSNIAKLANAYVDSIPNPYAEWAGLVLKKFLEMPNGYKIIEFLKMLVERGYFIVRREGYSRGAAQPNWQPFLDRVKKKLKANPAELEEILTLTVKGKSEYLYTEYTEGTKTDVHLMCGEYHLDLILFGRRESWTGHPRYDEWYEVRHKDALKKVLGELSI